MKRLAATLGAALCLLTTGGIASASGGGSDPNYAPLPRKIAREVSSVTSATLNAVGAGHANVAPKLVHWANLKAHRKPELAYIMAEFCPYCASENWSVAVALSRFGTFSGLTTLTTPEDEQSIQTVSYRHAHYRSKYLAFNPIVNENVHLKQVQKVPRKVQRAWNHEKYLGYPFMDFGGKAALERPSYDPSILKGMTRAEIAAILDKRHSAVAQSIDGTANQLTAAICVMTDNQPTSICASKPIAKIRKHLEKLHH